MSTVQRQQLPKKNGRFISVKRENGNKRRLEALREGRQRIADKRQREKALHDASDGLTVADLRLMTELMVCEGCQELLYWPYMVKQETFGMASLVHFRCTKCNRVRVVPSSEYRVGANGKWIFKINEEMTDGTAIATARNDEQKQWLQEMKVHYDELDAESLEAPAPIAINDKSDDDGPVTRSKTAKVEARPAKRPRRAPTKYSK